MIDKQTKQRPSFGHVEAASEKKERKRWHGRSSRTKTDCRDRDITHYILHTSSNYKYRVSVCSLKNRPDRPDRHLPSYM